MKHTQTPVIIYIVDIKTVNVDYVHQGVLNITWEMEHANLNATWISAILIMDCGCGHCSLKYDATTLRYIQTGTTDPCDKNCLVFECRYGIDFCTDKSLIKKGILNSLVFRESIKMNWWFCEYYGCSSEDMSNYLNGTDHCKKNNHCNTKPCAYCLGQANITFENCSRQSYDECLLCDSSILEIFCFRDLSECPNRFEDIQEIANFFGNPHWCLKEPTYYSKSNYKEIFVDASVSSNGNEGNESTVKSLYKALVDVYAAYTKIYLLNKEIDFFVDGSTSILINDVYDPLNIKTLYKNYELWIIGSYSDTEKTTINYKDNIIITPLAERFYLKNIEFVGKNVMDRKCNKETCFYCPYR